MNYFIELKKNVLTTDCVFIANFSRPLNLLTRMSFQYSKNTFISTNFVYCPNTIVVLALWSKAFTILYYCNILFSFKLTLKKSAFLGQRQKVDDNSLSYSKHF